MVPESHCPQNKRAVPSFLHARDTLLHFVEALKLAQLSFSVVAEQESTARHDPRKQTQQTRMQ